MRASLPAADYLVDADILYIRVRDGEVARTWTPDHWRNVDLDARGAVIAVEFINAVSAGIDLEGLPERDTLERAIRARVPLYPELDAALTDRARIARPRAALAP